MSGAKHEIEFLTMYVDENNISGDHYIRNVLKTNLEGNNVV